MGVDGGNMTCSDCHHPAAGGHHITGSRYSNEVGDRLACTDCHDTGPHDGGTELGARLNSHMDRVACQTCHIPAYARGGQATKMTWDWSTVGTKNPDGSDLVIPDENGDPVYHTKKGSFTWQANVVPEYLWFNGDVTFIGLDDPVSSNELVTINRHHGDINDAQARITPVKRFTGSQPYDAGMSRMAIPHLFPYNAADTNALWKTYNWDWSLAAGQAAVGRTYSGQLGFLDTEMFWVQNHMVAPKEQALRCGDCHTPQGRLDFAALGYPAEQAAVLQTLAGFDITQVDVSPVSTETAVVLVWMGTPGFGYQVQQSDDLITWSSSPSGDFAIMPGLPPAELQWTNQGSGPAARAYKIVRNPLP